MCRLLGLLSQVSRRHRDGRRSLASLHSAAIRESSHARITFDSAMQEKYVSVDSSTPHPVSKAKFLAENFSIARSSKRHTTRQSNKVTSSQPRHTATKLLNQLHPPRNTK